MFVVIILIHQLGGGILCTSVL